MPPCSYCLPDVAARSGGTAAARRARASSMKCAAFSADSLTARPGSQGCRPECPQLREPCDGGAVTRLDSWKRGRRRAARSPRARRTVRRSREITPYSSTVVARRLGRASSSGTRAGAPVQHDARHLERRVVVREMITPEMRVCVSPPSSSAVTSSPVAAFTSGGRRGRSCPGSSRSPLRAHRARRRRPQCTSPSRSRAAGCQRRHARLGEDAAEGSRSGTRPPAAANASPESTR